MKLESVEGGAESPKESNAPCADAAGSEASTPSTPETTFVSHPGDLLDVAVVSNIYYTVLTLACEPRVVDLDCRVVEYAWFYC